MDQHSERPCVGIGVMIFKDGKVLLGKRKKASHGSGEYCFPGGHLEFGESFEECARREVREECGLEIQNVRFELVANVQKYERHHVLVGFIADWKAGEPQVLEPEKLDSWNWYNVDELPQPLFRATELMIESYKSGKYYSDL